MTHKVQRQPGWAGAGEAALLNKRRTDVFTGDHIPPKRAALASLLRPKALAPDASSGGAS